MATQERSAERFVQAVYRRLLVVRAIEQIARGVLAASVLAIVLLLVGAWQKLPLPPILLFCFVVGIVSGLVLFFFRKPARLQAVLEADRQLRFDDLLSSAVFPSNRGDPEFVRLIQQMADARCMMHQPSEVFLRQMGLRSWSTVGLLMSIAVTLAAIPFQPDRSQATDANASVLSAVDPQPASHSAAAFTAILNDPMSESAASKSITNQSPADSAKIDAAENSNPQTASRGNHPGVGGGHSTTESNNQQKFSPGESPGRSSASTGTTAGGGTASNVAGDGMTSSSGTISAQPRSNSPSNRWTDSTSSNPPGDFRVDDNRIPPKDRDLVHDFFAR